VNVCKFMSGPFLFCVSLSVGQTPGTSTLQMIGYDKRASGVPAERVTHCLPLLSKETLQESMFLKL
jgi:hypothetical protein